MTNSEPITIEELLTHEEWLRLLSLILLSDRERAEDIAQDTWAVALSRPPRHRGNLRGWLATVARNLARQLTRREGIDWVKLEIMRPFGDSRHGTIAAQDVPLESGVWTRAEIESEAPPGLQFGLAVRFSGKKGGVLWLDDATRLPVEYMTVPREWSRLAHARAFPESLLAEKVSTGQDPAPEHEGLTDPSFESGTLAPMPMSGWYSRAMEEGLARIAPDTETLTDGKRSLRVDVLRIGGRGRPAVSRVFTTALSTPALSFSVDLRASRATSVAIEVLAMGSFRQLANRRTDLEADEWTREEVRFPLPEDGKTIGVFIYFPRETGVTLWLDHARVSPAK